MATTVTVEVIDRDGEAGVPEAIARALRWFEVVERACSRFDPQSELMQLCSTLDQSVRVSPVLCRALDLAVNAARRTNGAFDPVIGSVLAARGFDREYRSGAQVHAPRPVSRDATYRDVVVDVDASAVALARPLLLDLGAVAKGLAIDLAAQELAPLQNFAISAGGDIYAGGTNSDNELWAIGIRHPRDPGEIIETVRVSNAAICTSGDYERRSSDGGHHLIDARTRLPVSHLASVSVRAATAVAADTLATAAFVLGVDAGCALLDQEGAAGVFYSPSLARAASSCW